jgi:hypothetical protein
MFTTAQLYAKAYPGIRQLSLIRQLGARGTLGSICPSQLSQPTKLSFGYEATVHTLIEATAPVLE